MPRVHHTMYDFDIWISCNLLYNNALHMRIHVENDEQLLSQVFCIATPHGHYNACGQPSNISWQSQTDRMLDLLEERVVGIEDRLESVVDGIAKNLTELCARSHHFRNDARL